MNILFYHGDETCPTMGGIQRTTALIAEGLRNYYGYRCYNFYDYSTPYPENIPRYDYEESVRLDLNFSAESVAKLIDRWKIDVIINQMSVEQHINLKKAIQLSRHECKLIYCHHNTPNRLFNLSFKQRYLSVLSSPSFPGKIKNFLKLMAHPVYSRWHDSQTLTKNRLAYRSIYNDSDKFLLLSKRFIPEWIALTGIENPVKLDAIPNMTSFHTFLSEQQIKHKQKRVLLVARLKEFPKNISAALRIWKNISEDPSFSEWQFDIVGHGVDEAYLKAYVKQHKIKRVNFLGRQESQPYYEKSSVFIMPSIREGWGMTLLESMQNGCVPIAFDSFASVRDIIDDGHNGYLVPAFDENEFAEKLRMLLADTSKRHDMATNAIEKSKEFTEEKIVAKWNDLLQEVVNK